MYVYEDSHIACGLLTTIYLPVGVRRLGSNENEERRCTIQSNGREKRREVESSRHSFSVEHNNTISICLQQLIPLITV